MPSVSEMARRGRFQMRGRITEFFVYKRNFVFFADGGERSDPAVVRETPQSGIVGISVVFAVRFRACAKKPDAVEIFRRQIMQPHTFLASAQHYATYRRMRRQNTRRFADKTAA